MATSAYILLKAANAVRDWLKTQTIADIASDRIYATNASGLRVPPCIEVVCQNAATEEGTAFTGNWMTMVEIQLRSDGTQTTEEEHHERARALVDLVCTDSFAADVSDLADDFTVILSVPKNQATILEGDHWLSGVAVLITCCGSDLG